MTRYEQPGGGTSTSTERMVYYSPEISGPRIEETRAEWQIYSELASHVYPERRASIHYDNSQDIREEIAKAAPSYEGIQYLQRTGDVFQYGGAWLCEGGICPTSDGRGKLIAIELPERRKPEGHFYMTTRRGKKFNSMIYGEKDSFNAAERNDVLIDKEDGRMLNIQDGEAIIVYNHVGMLHGQAKFANIRKGNIELYWPEANVLFPKGVYEQHAGIPEYNATVIVEQADTYHANKDTRYVEKRVDELEDVTN